MIDQLQAAGALQCISPMTEARGKAQAFDILDLRLQLGRRTIHHRRQPLFLSTQTGLIEGNVQT